MPLDAKKSEEIDTVYRYANANTIKKYLIFSDIQGNYESFERFRRGALTFHRDVDICLGDVINKGSVYNENRIVELLRNFDYHPNNKDSVLCARGDHEERLKTHKNKLSEENFNYLLSLPDSIRYGNILAFHSSLRKPGERLDSLDKIREEVKFLEEKGKLEGIGYVLYGHTHKICVFSYDRKNRKLEDITEKEVSLEDGKKYFINPGGIGPYYGLPQTIAVLDDSKKLLRFYDLDKWMERHEMACGLLFFEEIIKYLSPKRANEGLLVHSLEEDIRKLSELNSQGIFDDAIKIMKSYRLPDSKKRKKKYLSDFSLRLAEEFEKLYVPDVYENYKLFSPKELREQYLKW